MKILHLASEYPPQPVYGLGRYVAELAEAQAKLGHATYVVTNSMGGKDAETFQRGVHVRRVGFPPPPKAPVASAMLLHFNMQLVERTLEVFAGNQTPDVLCAHDWLTFPATFHLGRLLKRTTVTTIHDVIFKKVRHRQFSAEDEFVAGIEHWACHNSQRVIALSEHVKQELISAYNVHADRIAVIPGGVGILPIESGELPGVLRWRERFAPTGKTLLLYVGRLDAEKGIGVLLGACTLLKEQGCVSWHLIVAGAGQCTESVQHQIGENHLDDKVTLVGYQPLPELRIAYAGSDITVLPSTYEPFGLVALESQRMGTPVIASNVGGLAETLRVTKGGLEFESGNRRSLAEKLRLLIDDKKLAREFGLRGQERVRSEYNWGGIGMRVCQVLEAAAAQPKQLNATMQEQVPALPDSMLQPINKADGERSFEDPVNALTVILDRDAMDRYLPIVEHMSKIHALKALNGKINVITATMRDGGDANTCSPDVMAKLDRVCLHQLHSNADFEVILQQSAALFIPLELREAILSGKILDPECAPIIWLGKARDDIAWTVDNLEALHVAANKVLCDDRMRASIAPKLANPICDFGFSSPARRNIAVLHILPQLVTGGAETMLLELIRGSCSTIDHSVLVTSEVVNGALPQELAACGIAILTASIPRDIEAAIRSIAPDVLHLHSMSYVENWMRVHRRLQGIPVIETEHVVGIGSGHFGHNDIVACVSKAALSAHARYTPAMRDAAPEFCVIYNGINAKAYENLPSKAEARQRLGLPVDKPIIGRISALSRNKLSLEALQSLRHLHRNFPEALFVIVGDGPDRKGVENFLREHEMEDRVRLLGERRDIPEVLAAFDVFAYYTLKESLGNVIVEAAAAGVPVVTTDVEGTVEALNGARGEIVPLNDFEAFASAVKRWSKEEARRNPIDSRFTREHMAREYTRRYQSLACRASATPKVVDVTGPLRAKFPLDLLIKFPTRSRPAKFFNTLELYRANLSGRYKVKFLVSCDGDDDSMNSKEVKDRFARYPDVDVLYSANRCKVEAINAGVSAYDFQILLVASDDMIPVTKNFDDVIVGKMHANYPDLDGVLFFNDGFRGIQVNTLPIMGRKYYERFGYIYHPAYQSLWCDNEFTEVASALGKQAYFEEVLIRHDHPANVGAGIDLLYERNDRSMSKDRQTYEERRRNNFDLSRRVSLNAPSSTAPRKKILFVCMFRLGDVLCAGPAFKALRRENPGAHLGWAILEEYRSLVPAYADETVPVSSTKDDFAARVREWSKEWDLVINAQPSFQWQRWAESKMPLVRFIAELAGVGLRERKIEIPVKLEHRAAARQMVGDLGDFVVINGGPHHSGPNWPASERASLIETLRAEGYQAVVLSGQDGTAMPNALNIQSPNVHISVAIMERAGLYIGQDCGTSWIACAARATPKIILIDQSEGRAGYDSYVQALDDANITELPLGVGAAEIVEAAMKALPPGEAREQ